MITELFFVLHLGQGKWGNTEYTLPKDISCCLPRKKKGLVDFLLLLVFCFVLFFGGNKLCALFWGEKGLDKD